ncbi:hypothetical protein D3C85_173460 [compost metagenome]
MSEVFEYSPQQVNLIIAGYKFSGWQSIRIARRMKTFQPVYGIRGKNTRVKNRDTSCVITLPLLQTSQGNDVLSEIHRLDGERLTGRLTITLKDLSGQSVFSSIEAYVDGYPEVAYSGDMEYRVWTLILQSSDWHVGGNASPQSSLIDSLLGQIGSIFG